MASEKYTFEQYLNVRMAYGPSFSPDSSRLSFLTDITGVAEVWSVPIDIRSAYPLWPQQLTFRGERVASATFSPTSDVLLVAGDIGGNERTQFFSLSGNGSTFTPLTNNLDVIYDSGKWSPDGTRLAYSSNERDSRYFDVYERNMETGEVKQLLRQDGTNYVGGYSPDGQQVLVMRYLTNTANQLLLVDTQTGEIRPLTQEVRDGRMLYEQAAWSADRKGLFVLSNYDRQFFSLAYLDLATTELTYLTDASWDAELLAVTADGKYLAMVTNEDGYSRLELFDLSAGWDAREILHGPTLPGGVIQDLKWSPDGTKLGFTFTTAIDPPDVWVWDIEAGDVWRATQSSLGGVQHESFVSASLVRYPTFDGREIPAFLYLPQHEQTQNIPIVINVHGGPEGQALPIFNAITQYLVSRGYGVLAPNVRGSTGYGYDYQSLDDVRLRMDSVKDLLHAALWLRESGIADPRRIAVMGGSYGGFMVLSAVTTYPDVWAASVDIVGIANFITFLENTGPWRRKLREAEYGSLENDREFLEQISPIHHVDRVTAPMFVVHGANDPRVPVGEAEQMVSALHTRNIPVEYMRFEDEGHGLIKRMNRLIAYPAIARFLDEHLRL